MLYPGQVEGESDVGRMTACLDRRAVLAGLAALLGGCATQRAYYPYPAPQGVAAGGYFPGYGPIADDGHHIPGLDSSTVDADRLRRQVPFAGPYRPGTIVVDVADRRLYLVQPGGMAMRYTVGVGREEALNFRGSAVIGRKAEWPRWTPTPWMIKTMPRYAAYAGGMAGGIGNPLGARALYLYRGNRDTYFRLHGTNEPETIGTAVSSGCIRLFNHDIIDLYNRVPVGAPVVVLQEPGAMAEAQEPPPDGSHTAEAGPGPYGSGSYGGGPEDGPYYDGGQPPALSGPGAAFPGPNGWQY
jgi:lipoprotein-anchoring transpeptidase ErfK/SrfK